VLEFAQFAGTSPEKLSSLPHMELFNKARAFVKSIEGQSSATVARKMSAIRSYINFLCNIGILKANPLDFIKVGKVHNAERSS
jgi:site-specific recombinase XerC